MKFYIFMLFVLFAFPYSCFSSMRCKFNVDLQQTLSNNGFHRNLSYTISFHDDYGIWLNKNCVIALEQILPTGIYTNPNELADLRRLNRANIFPNKRMDIEAMAEDSDESVVYVIGKVLENKVKLFLPLHARYHAARAGGGIVTNNLLLPSLYLRCPDNRLHDCDEALPSAASVLCHDKPKMECDWKQITYVSLSSPFNWEVPVGDTDSLMTISIGTCVAIIAGTCFLIDALIMYNSRLKGGSSGIVRPVPPFQPNRANAELPRAQSTRRGARKGEKGKSAGKSASITAAVKRAGTSRGNSVSNAPRLKNTPNRTSTLKPFFLWSKINVNKVVNIECEEYDAGNRIRIVRTSKNTWRCIPITPLYNEIIIPPPSPEPLVTLLSPISVQTGDFHDAVLAASKLSHGSSSSSTTGPDSPAVPTYPDPNAPIASESTKYLAPPIRSSAENPNKTADFSPLESLLVVAELEFVQQITEGETNLTNCDYMNREIDSTNETGNLVQKVDDEDVALLDLFDQNSFEDCNFKSQPDCLTKPTNTQKFNEEALNSMRAAEGLLHLYQYGERMLTPETSYWDKEHLPNTVYKSTNDSHEPQKDNFINKHKLLDEEDDTNGDSKIKPIRSTIKDKIQQEINESTPVINNLKDSIGTNKSEKTTIETDLNHNDGDGNISKSWESSIEIELPLESIKINSNPGITISDVTGSVNSLIETDSTQDIHYTPSSERGRSLTQISSSFEDDDEVEEFFGFEKPNKFEITSEITKLAVFETDETSILKDSTLDSATILNKKQVPQICEDTPSVSVETNLLAAIELFTNDERMESDTTEPASVQSSFENKKVPIKNYTITPVKSTIKHTSLCTKNITKQTVFETDELSIIKDSTLDSATILNKKQVPQICEDTPSVSVETNLLAAIELFTNDERMESDTAGPVSVQSSFENKKVPIKNYTITPVKSTIKHSSLCAKNITKQAVFETDELSILKNSTLDSATIKNKKQVPQICEDTPLVAVETNLLAAVELSTNDKRMESDTTGLASVQSSFENKKVSIKNYTITPVKSTIKHKSLRTKNITKLAVFKTDEPIILKNSTQDSATIFNKKQVPQICEDTPLVSVETNLLAAVELSTNDERMESDTTGPASVQSSFQNKKVQVKNYTITPVQSTIKHKSLRTKSKTNILSTSKPTFKNSFLQNHSKTKIISPAKLKYKKNSKRNVKSSVKNPKVKNPQENISAYKFKSVESVMDNQLENNNVLTAVVKTIEVGLLPDFAEFNVSPSADLTVTHNLLEGVNTDNLSFLPTTIVTSNDLQNYLTRVTDCLPPNNSDDFVDISTEQNEARSLHNKEHTFVDTSYSKAGDENNNKLVAGNKAYNEHPFLDQDESIPEIKQEPEDIIIKKEFPTDLSIWGLEDPPSDIMVLDQFQNYCRKCTKNCANTAIDNSLHFHGEDTLQCPFNGVLNKNLRVCADPLHQFRILKMSEKYSISNPMYIPKNKLDEIVLSPFYAIQDLYGRKADYNNEHIMKSDNEFFTLSHNFMEFLICERITISNFSVGALLSAAGMYKMGMDTSQVTADFIITLIDKTFNAFYSEIFQLASSYELSITPNLVNNMPMGMKENEFKITLRYLKEKNNISSTLTDNPSNDRIRWMLVNNIVNESNHQAKQMFGRYGLSEQSKSLDAMQNVPRNTGLLPPQKHNQSCDPKNVDTGKDNVQTLSPAKLSSPARTSPPQVPSPALESPLQQSTSFSQPAQRVCFSPAQPTDYSPAQLTDYSLAPSANSTIDRRYRSSVYESNTNAPFVSPQAPEALPTRGRGGTIQRPEGSPVFNPPGPSTRNPHYLPSYSDCFEQRSIAESSNSEQDHPEFNHMYSSSEEQSSQRRKMLERNQITTTQHETALAEYNHYAREHQFQEPGVPTNHLITALQNPFLDCQALGCQTSSPYLRRQMPEWNQIGMAQLQAPLLEQQPYTSSQAPKSSYRKRQYQQKLNQMSGPKRQRVSRNQVSTRFLPQQLLQTHQQQQHQQQSDLHRWRMQQRNPAITAQLKSTLATSQQHTSITATPQRCRLPMPPQEYRLALAALQQHTSTLVTSQQHTSTLVTPQQHTSTLVTPQQYTSTPVTPQQYTLTVAPLQERSSTLATQHQYTSALAALQQSASTLATPQQHTSTQATPQQHTSTLVTPHRYSHCYQQFYPSRPP